MPLSRQGTILNGSQWFVGERRLREERRALQLRPEQDGFHQLYLGERLGIGLCGIVSFQQEKLKSMILKVACCDFKIFESISLEILRTAPK